MKASTSRRTAKLCVTLPTTLLLAVGSMSNAYADPWGTDDEDTGAKPDNFEETYCWGSGFDSNLQDNVDGRMGYMDSATDMYDTYVSSCTSLTDVVWFDADLSGSQRGSTVCQGYNGAGECEISYSTLDPAEIANGDNDEHDLDKTICHELGHDLGLTHYKDADNDYPNAPNGESDCMISGEVINTESYWIAFSQHHKDHINNGVS